MISVTGAIILTFLQVTQGLSSAGFQKNVTQGQIQSIDVTECGKTKGCFRTPRLCQPDKCLYIVTWKEDKVKGQVQFELGAKITSTAQPPWIALGFSDDLNMPKTSVVDCIVDAADDAKITIQASYNPGHFNQVLNDNELGLLPKESSASYINGRLMCKFTKLIQVPKNSTEYSKVADLQKAYYLLLAEGPTDGNGKKEMHTIIPVTSPEKVDVSKNTDINIGRLGQENLLILTHATLMILSWMFLSSIGIVSSRHFKNVWANRICGQKLWFQIHRLLLSTCVLFTCVALVLIVVAESWRPLQTQELHPIIGIVVAGLMIINALLALCRPSPTDPKRPLFNWVHCLVGNCAHLVAVAAMYFGVKLLMTKIPDVPTWGQWVVVGFGGWRILTEVIMTAQKYYSKEDLQIAYVEMSGSLEGTRIESPAYTFKTVMVVIYLCGVLGLTVALLYGVLQAFME